MLDAAGDKVFEHDFGKGGRALDSYGNFEELNSPERAQRWLALRNAQTRLGAGEASPGRQRQAWFHHAPREQGDRRKSTTPGGCSPSWTSRIARSSGVSSRTGCTPSTPGAAARCDGGAARRGHVLARAPSTPPDEDLRRKAASWERAIQLSSGCCSNP